MNWYKHEKDKKIKHGIKIKKEEEYVEKLEEIVIKDFEQVIKNLVINTNLIFKYSKRLIDFMKDKDTIFLINNLEKITNYLNVKEELLINAILDTRNDLTEEQKEYLESILIMYKLTD